MAITFTLVSFTCTVGFVGVVLAEAAKGNVFYPVMGMLAFSIAFSLPFFFLAVFPSWADKLRGKSGDWMVAIKVTLGFLELAGAFKFLSNVDLVLKWEFVTRPFVLSFWAGIFILCALYLLRIFNLSGSNADQRSVGPVRMAFALLMLSLGVYSFTGIRDTKSMGGWLDGWLPPAHYPGSESDLSEYGTDRLPWIVDNIEEGMKRAKRENKPLFIDFTGYTCTNCRYMEGSVFPKPKVRALLEKMILVTAYTDGNSEICAEQRKYQINRFDTAALPFYAILNPHNDTVLARHPDMTKNVAKFIEFLSGGIKEFDSVKPLDIPLKDSLVARQQPTVDGGTSDAGMSDSKDLLVLANSGKTVDFKFPGLFTNDKTKLSSLRGNWVLLNFWASWCAPCKKELKNDFPVALKEFKDVKFVTVAFDGEETAGSARKFLKTVDLNNHTHLMGGEDITEAGLSKDFNVSESLPFTYLLHPGGYIAWMKKGSVDLKLLKSLLKKTIK